MPPSAPLLLFVCLANSCRSPMAETIAKHQAQALGWDVRVASAGLAAIDGSSPTPGAAAAIAQLGLSLEGFRAKAITRELIDEASLVVTATAAQRDQLRKFVKSSEAKIVSFNDLTAEGDIEDPIGGSEAEFQATRDRINLGMPKVLGALLERTAATR